MTTLAEEIKALGIPKDEMRKIIHWMAYMAYMEKATEYQRSLFTSILQREHATLKEAYDAIVTGEYAYIYADPWTGKLQLPS